MKHIGKFIFLLGLLFSLVFIRPVNAEDINFDVNVHDVSAPTAPRNLQAEIIDKDKARLIWDSSTDNLSVVGYSIYDGLSNNLIGQTPNLSYILINLSQDVSYFYYVKAYDASGNISDPSNTVEVKISSQLNLSLSNVPSQVEAGQDFPNSIRITVSDSFGNVVTNYSGTVYFYSSDPKANLKWNASNPYTFTLADAGVHNFSGTEFQLNTLGKQVLSATDGTLSASATIEVIKTPLTLDEILKNIVDILKNLPEATKKFIQENSTLLNTATVVTTALLFTVPTLVDIGFSIGNILTNLIYVFLDFLQIIGVRRRRKPWGIVFDSESSEPLSLVIVRIHAKQYNKVLEQVASDRSGRYGFLPREGTFYLTAQKTGYKFPGHLSQNIVFEDIYQGGDFQIEGEKTVVFNIPLDPIVKVRQFNRYVFWIKIARFFRKIHFAIMIAGVVIAVASIAIIWPKINYFGIISLIFYILIFILDNLRTKNLRQYGQITDQKGIPLEMAIVRLFDGKINRLVGTDVTDRSGRFIFLVGPGRYYLTVIKPTFESYRSANIEFAKKEDIIANKITLKKKDSSQEQL